MVAVVYFLVNLSMKTASWAMGREPVIWRGRNKYSCQVKANNSWRYQYIAYIGKWAVGSIKSIPRSQKASIRISTTPRYKQ